MEIFLQHYYGSLNDLYIGLQTASLGALQREEWRNPLTGACFGNLGGSPNYHQTDAIPGIASSMTPFSSATKGLSTFKKLNAADFSHLFKGTHSRSSLSYRGFLNRWLNMGIEKVNNNVGGGRVIVDGVSVS